MRVLARRKEHQNRAAVDPWTAVHFSVGLAAGLLGFSRRWTVPAAIAYELVEQALERSPIGQEFFDTAGPESVENAIMDVAIFAVGHELGAAWNRTGDGTRD